ncbi:MAG: metallophosphoesterase [Clostridia bacterium]|nr:metallophosphoesterase [Clostridia bacterium]
MYALNMAINVIVSAIMVLQAAFALPVTSAVFFIDSEAVVFESGDEMYTIIWSTSLPGTGWVNYTYEGTEYEVRDLQNSAVRTTDTVHSVRVPKAHLDHNAYTYSSQQIGTRRAYVAVKGRTVTSGPVEFKGYAGQEEINVLVLSDIHEDPYVAQKAVDNFTAEPDLLILNGDLVSYMTSVLKFKQILSYAHRFSGGQIPVIYTRGNHENRGTYGPEAVDIFKISTRGQYFTCSYGPISFLCLDTGEDKDDDDWTYSGLVDSTTYIAGETEWLKTLSPDEDAAYRIAVGHMPNVDNRYGFNWVPTLTALKTDLFVAGHKHRLNFAYRRQASPFPVMIDGGKTNDDGFIATMLTFGGGKVKALCYDNENNLAGEHVYEIGR